MQSWSICHLVTQSLRGPSPTASLMSSDPYVMLQAEE